MSYQFGKRSKERMEGVDPQLITVAELALKISHHRGGPDFTIPKYGGVRTVEEQQALFAKKRSKADGVNKKSYHQSGKALDVIAYVDGSATYEEEYLYEVAVCMLEAAAELGVKLEWGGNWRGKWDKPHYQI